MSDVDDAVSGVYSISAHIRPCSQEVDTWNNSADDIPTDSDSENFGASP